MKYVLLTGATGLVGHYLLRGLLAADESVAVVTRSSRAASAAARIDSVMAFWERQCGRTLRRPVVLEGDLRQPGLGLEADDRRWIGQHCDRVLHSAASMTFRQDKQGEPFRTNVDGMQNLLGLCRELKIRALHHVSTAYICGLRTGRIMEDEVDLGQQNGNLYEVSKLAAEKMVRAADHFESTTIYRPASVVGDSQTGFTTSSHGFYLPLQLAYLIADKVPPELMGERFLKLLGLSGDEGKNLVPVDWLAAAIVRLFLEPKHHGRTYHLTHPQPVTVRLIQQVVREAVNQHAPSQFVGRPTEEELAAYEAQFKDYMQVYRSHWRDDPRFDRTHTEQALPDLPCPEMDHARMFRIASYPIERKFLLHQHEGNGPLAQRPAISIEQFLRAACAARPSGSEQQAAPPLGGLCADRPWGERAGMGLEVSGTGGGQWSLVPRADQGLAVERGLSDADQFRLYMSAASFARLASGAVSVASALATGRIVVERRSGSSESDAASWLQRIFRQTPGDVAVASSLSRD